MRYAGIIYNDFSAAPGVCLTFFTQGCPHRCKGCHNPETWDFDGGKEFTHETLNSIIEGLTANGVKRNLCIMGGEPLSMGPNIILTQSIITEVKKELPEIKIYIWTGYTYEYLQKVSRTSFVMRYILKHTDVLIDGLYIEEERDITLSMRGSRNQRIINLKTGEILNDNRELKKLD